MRLGNGPPDEAHFKRDGVARANLALRRIDPVNLRFEDVVDERIISPIRKTHTLARDIEATSVDFPIHSDVRRVLHESRTSSLRRGRCPFIVHREPERQTRRASQALEAGRVEHSAQVLPEYASKAFNKAREVAANRTDLFAGLTAREMPTLHEIRALSSHLYARAGYDVDVVQELMAHTDPDMTRAYQKGHARKVLRVDVMLPFSVTTPDDSIGEERGDYRLRRVSGRQEIFPENFLTRPGAIANMFRSRAATVQQTPRTATQRDLANRPSQNIRSDPMNTDRSAQCPGNVLDVVGIARDDKIATGKRSGDDRCVDNVARGRACTRDSGRPSTPFVEVLDSAAS